MNPSIVIKPKNDERGKLYVCVDYHGQASFLEWVAASAADEGEMDQVTISKYPGGDEEHTNLVKSLDVALARWVKREMDKETSNWNWVRSITFDH
jgi:hypothetical protein